MRFTLLTRKAERDLRQMPEQERKRLRQAIVGLERGAATDVRPLKGRQPWRRMRVGDFRVLFRNLTSAEVQRLGRRGEGFLVARVVNRRDLDRAVGSL